MHLPIIAPETSSLCLRCKKDCLYITPYRTERKKNCSYIWIVHHESRHHDALIPSPWGMPSSSRYIRVTCISHRHNRKVKAADHMLEVRSCLAHKVKSLGCGSEASRVLLAKRTRVIRLSVAAKARIKFPYSNLAHSKRGARALQYNRRFEKGNQRREHHDVIKAPRHAQRTAEKSKAIEDAAKWF